MCVNLDVVLISWLPGNNYISVIELHGIETFRSLSDATNQI